MERKMRNKIVAFVAGLLLSMTALANHTFVYQINGEGLEGQHIVVLFVNEIPVVIDTVETDGSPIRITIDGIASGRYLIYARVYNMQAQPLFETEARMITITFE